MSENRFAELITDMDIGSDENIDTPAAPEVSIPLTDCIARIALDEILTAREWSKFDSGPNLIVIDVFSADMAEIVGDHLHERRTAALVETVTEKRKVMGKLVNGGQKALDYLEKGKPVIVVSQDPQGLVADVVRAAADVTLVIPRFDSRLVRKLVRMVTGRTMRGLRESDVERLDIADFQAAIRPGLTGAQCKALLRRCAMARRIPRSNVVVPDLDEITLTRLVRNWTEETRALMRAVVAGEGSPRDLSFALFEGVPGGGKTTLAAALAQAEGWEFVSTSIGEWFDSSDGHLGGVTKASRRFFETVLMSRRPVIGFIDEIDSLPNRATMDAHDAQWWTPVVTGVLTDIDKCRHSGRPILLIAATNHFSRLDGALVRPGRLETKVSFVPPDADERQEMFARRLGDRLSTTELQMVARLATGATPAHIESWCTGAVVAAGRAGRSVAVGDLVALIAPERRSDKMLRAIALHESGHAIVTLELGMTLMEVSLLARGDMGGSVSASIEDMLMTRNDVEALVTMTMGGRAADNVLGDGPNAGAAGDLAAASQLLDDAVSRFGLYGSLRSGSRAGGQGPMKAKQLEGLLDRLARRAETIVQARRGEVLALADALLIERVMTPERVKAVISESRRELNRHDEVHVPEAPRGHT